MTVSKFPTCWDYCQVAPQPPWWWKFELNNPGWKLKIRATLIAILCYLEAKFDYYYFIFFWVMAPKFYIKILSHFKQKWRRDGDFHDSCDFYRNFVLSRGKIWLWLFNNFFLCYGSTILHKKFQVISSKIEGLMAIFMILDFCKFFIKVWTLKPYMWYLFGILGTMGVQ